MAASPSLRVYIFIHLLLVSYTIIPSTKSAAGIPTGFPDASNATLLGTKPLVFASSASQPPFLTIGQLSEPEPALPRAVIPAFEGNAGLPVVATAPGL